MKVMYVKVCLTSKDQNLETSQNLAHHKYESLINELQSAQDHAAKQQQDLDRKMRLSEEHARSLQEDLEESQAQLSTLDRQHQRQLQDVEMKRATLQSTLDEMRGELEQKSSALQEVQDQLSQRDAKFGQLESELLSIKAQVGYVDNIRTTNNELSEQVAHIRKLEKSYRDQGFELNHFRQVHKAVEIVEEEKRALQYKLRLMDDLRHELGEVQIQKQVLEAERKSWTSYLQEVSGQDGAINFDGPEAVARALMQAQLENASLIERLGAVQPEISAREEMIRGLENEKGKLYSELEKLRATGGESRTKSRLERQKALAVKEVEYLRAQLKTFESEDLTTEVGEEVEDLNIKRMKDLESLIDQYRGEIENLNNDLSKRDESLSTPDQRNLKRLHDDDPDERLGLLSRKNRKLQTDLSTVQQSSSLLQTELTAIKSQLSSIQETSRTRILSLRSNPTSDFEDMKFSHIAILRDENKALLTQIEGLPHETKVVPISSLQSARLEIENLEKLVAERDKRLLRLRKVCEAKVMEFREAVQSLLGWRIDWLPNGKMKMTSSLNPGDIDEDNEEDSGSNYLIFDGKKGEMKVGSGPQSEFAREIRGLIRYWVEERKEFPTFLAAATLEFYEKTTRALRIT